MKAHRDLLELRKLVLRENAGPLFPAGTLIRMVYDSANHSAWSKGPWSRPDITPEPVLRSLVTYSYATGLLSSLDIASAAGHDSAVRYLCAGHEPTWQEIRDFRRRNTPGLKLALARLFATGDRPFRDLKGHPPARWSAHQFEAEKRLAQAVQADSCALDV